MTVSDATNPYLGLDYFDVADAHLFFGREGERTRLMANLRASRLTLLYAQSGVGKSSLLRAGVVARVREIARRNVADSRSPGYIPVVFNSWRGDPLPKLIAELEAALRPFVHDGAPLELPREALDEALARGAEAVGGTPMVMLDQFEEYFLYHPDGASGERFADELARCVTRPELPAHFLISIREDAYSRIGDRFRARIPNVYANYLHLDYLDEPAARDAILLPIDEVNRDAEDGLPRFRVEPELVDAVLAQVRRDADDISDDEVTTNGHAGYETPLLQLVMERLWLEDAPSRVLRHETLTRIGGAKTIVSSHLEGAMRDLSEDQRAAGATVFRFLVTSGGAKIALTASELSELARLPVSTLEPLLRELERQRILRLAASAGEEPRYELFHDVLGAAVIQWRKDYEGQREAEALAEELQADEHRRLAEQKARHDAQMARLARRSAIVLSLLVVGLVIAVAVAIHQRGVAVHQRSVARSHSLSAASVTQLEGDPELAVALAAKAWDADHNRDAGEALRLSLAESRARGWLGTGKRPYVLADPKGRRVAVGLNDSVRVWDVGRRRWLPGPGMAPGGPISDISWSGDGSAVAVAGHGGVVVRRLDSQARRLVRGASVDRVSLDGAGAVAAVIRHRNVVMEDVRSGAHLATLRHPFDVADVQFVPHHDDQLGTASCGDGDVRLWKWRDESAVVLRRAGARRTHPPSTSTGACTLSFRADGNVVATAVSTKSPRLWNVRTHKFISELFGDEWVTGIGWGPRGQSLVVLARGEASLVPDASDPYNTVRLEVPGAEREPGAGGVRAGDQFITDADFSPDGRQIAFSTGDGKIVVADTADATFASVTAPVEFALTGHTADVQWLSFVAGDQIVSAGDDGTVRLWDARTPANLVGSAPDGTAVNAVAYRADGGLTALGLSNGEVRLVDPSDRRRQTIRTPKGARYVAGVHFSDRRHLMIAALAAGQKGGVILIADPVTRKITRRIRVPDDGEMMGATMTPAGAPFAEVEDSGAPKAYDDASHGWTALPWKHGVAGLGVDESADGRLVLIAGDDGRARLFDLRTRRQTAVVGPGGQGMIGAALSPDGKRVVTFGTDRVARVWSVRTGRRTAILRGHTAAILCAAFSADGKLVATAGSDKTLRVWDAGSGAALAAREVHREAVLTLAFDPRDRMRILTGSNDGTARIFTCETCGSDDRVRRLADRRVSEATRNRASDFARSIG